MACVSLFSIEKLLEVQGGKVKDVVIIVYYEDLLACIDLIQEGNMFVGKSGWLSSLQESGLYFNCWYDQY